MNVRWSEQAADDLVSIYQYIQTDNATAAQTTIRRILKRCRGLGTLPQQGQPGLAPGTRELLLAGLPYIVVYRIEDSWVEILQVWHGAQNR